MAVSKFHPAEYIEMAHAAGQRLFGESRVQELVEKWEGLRERYPDLVWHFIGPLQTNKVKYIAPFIHMIESVTSERLLLEICRQAQRVGRTIPILLEVHVAREETKSGFSPDELRELLGRIASSPETYRGVALHGLMAMRAMSMMRLSSAVSSPRCIVSSTRSAPRDCSSSPSSSPSSLWV